MFPSSPRWLIWTIYVLVMTAFLVMPVSASTSQLLDEWLLSRRMVAAKAVHVAAYAMLTILSAWLQIPARWRWLLLFLAMVHAPLSELVQQHMSNRTGCLEDVAINHLGIALGLLLSWKWWAAP